MSEQPVIHLFSKPDCGHCGRAKRLLADKGFAFVELDIEASSAMAAASRYYSGRVTVPQIFVGTQHINGAADLVALDQAGLLEPLIASAQGELPLDPSLEATWEAGAAEFTLAKVLHKVDLTQHLDDPENLLILTFYQAFFGFTPLSYNYLAIWPEAFRSCALSNVVATIPVLMMQIGQEAVDGVTYAASAAQGCTYCMVHTTAKDGVEQTDTIKALARARAGEAGPNNPFGELEVAMVELAEQATLNTVSSDQLARVRALADASSRDPQSIVEGVALGAKIMALLNIFNDLVNVEIEGDMAALAEQELGLNLGRHATTERNPNDLDFELPETTLTVETALAARHEKVESWRALAQQHLGYVPSWLEAWPAAMRGLFAGTYTELMCGGLIAPELKHLMARVSAIAKGHPALAASAAITARHLANDETLSLARTRQCFSVASGQGSAECFTVLRCTPRVPTRCTLAGTAPQPHATAKPMSLLTGSAPATAAA